MNIRSVHSLLFGAIVLILSAYAQEDSHAELEATNKLNEVQNNDLAINGAKIVQENGLAGLLTLGLMGGVMGLYAPKSRQNFNQNVDRSGYYEDPALTYAERIRASDDAIYRGIKSGVSRFANGARRTTRRMKNAFRRMGQRSLGVVRRAGQGVSNMARAADRSMRGIARTATRGLRRISSRLGRVGQGSIERMGETGVSIPIAAMRGLHKVSKAYLKGMTKAQRATLGGLKAAAQTYKRGLSRVGGVAGGIARAYTRGVSRIGSAARDQAYSSVDRMGEFVSQGASNIGDLATGVVDRVASVPKSLTNAVKDKKMRECVLQAMCYITTPFIDPNSNYVKRSVQDEDDIIPDLSEDESAILRMEDCEAFKCEVVSFGRQAYDLVAKSLLEEDIEKNK